MSLIYKRLPYINPDKIFEVVATRYATVFLDSKLQHDDYGRYSFIGIDPVQTITPQSDLSLQQQLPDWYSHAHTRVGDGNFSDNDIEILLPFTGGLMGYLSYEYAKQLEYSLANNHVIPAHKSVRETEVCLPDYWFGVYNQVFAFDNQEQVTYLLVTQLPETNAEGLLSKLNDIYNLAYKSAEIEVDKPEAIKLSSNFTKEEYISTVKRTIEYIKSGDIFEANIAQKFSAKINDKYDSKGLYKNLQLKNPAPFSAYLNLDDLKILSASPERFIKIINGDVEVRPIKGTIQRDNNPQKDNFLAQTLQSSAKDRAENIMIVDLMRNDLSKICEAHSIAVKQLCGLESFTNLHHLVSVINGKLKTGISIFDIIKAVFPAGSISGAPKIRSMQIIDELENHTPRGVSYGSIGYLGFNGNIDLSVAIRTITIYNNELSFHAGGAVTLYSDPNAEYEETMLKAQKLFESLSIGRPKPTFGMS